MVRHKIDFGQMELKKIKNYENSTFLVEIMIPLKAFKDWKIPLQSGDSVITFPTFPTT